MSFSGKFEVQSHENFEPFAKAFGLPSEFIEKYRDLKTIYEIVQNGKKFKFTATTGSTVVTNEITIGEEGELDIPTGEKMKAVFHMEGDNKLVTVAKEKNMTAVTEINGDTLTTVYRMGDIQYKRTSKRI